MNKLLLKLGANHKESETYLALLELGPQPISSIARRIGVPRSTMYTIIDSLKKLRLIDKFVRAKVTYVKAISAKDIQNVIRIHENELKQVQGLYNESLHQLETIENPALGILRTYWSFP